jgi:hypothetical protein
MVIALSYGGIVFMGYTLSPASLSMGVLPSGPYGYAGRRIATLPIIDPAASGTAELPTHKLVAQYFLSGNWALWNPYQAAGMPLVADSGPYAPFNLFYYLLPSELWDIPILLRLWLAGLFTYVFLKTRKTSRESAFVGAVLYMLSGAFTWYVSMDPLNVSMLTPLLLLAMDRLVASQKASDVCLASLVVTLSLLGANIEPIIIQFILVLLYYAFLTLGSSVRTLLAQTFRFVLSFAMGFGLSAFLLLPLFQYLANSSPLEYSVYPGRGLGALSSYAAITSFVPYFFGQVQSYISPSVGQVFGWNALGGYVGVCSLYLSFIAVAPRGTTSINKGEQRFAFFFFAIAIVALLKSYGVPPVQWIGYLPVLSFIGFCRYLGPVWAFGFSVTAAMGVERLLRCEVSKKTQLLAFGIASLTLITLASISVPFPLTPGSLSFFYSGWKLVEGFAFLCTITLLSVRLLDDRKMVMPLIGLIVLEMALYIPQGMPYGWEFLRSMVVLSTLVALIVVMIGRRTTLSRCLMRQNRGPRSSMRTSMRSILLLAILGSLVAQNAVAGLSPQGLPQRSDAFKPAPYVSFLQQNAGFSRVYTFDGILPPPYAGVFGLYQLGIYSGLNINSFHLFAKQNLDSGFLFTIFASNMWIRDPNAPGPVEQLHNNIEFYSLLGVKYLAAVYSDLSSRLIFLEPENVPEGTYYWAPLGNNSVSTQFVTDMSFDRVAVRIGTYDRVNRGEVILVLDSVPYDATFHRESRMNAESIVNGGFNMFTFAEVNVANKTEFRITLSQSDPRLNNEVAVMWWPQVKQNPHLMISDDFLRVALGVVLRDQFLPVVYHDQNATIYQNLRVFPRAFLVNHVVVVKDEEEAVLKSKNLGWSTRETLVLEGDLSDQLLQINSSDSMSRLDSAKIEQYSPNEVAVRVNASARSFLVLTDNFYPGWRAYVDGNLETIYRAYGVVRAVPVTAGSHEVVFRYEPDSLRLGTVISAASALIIVALCATGARIRYTQRRHGKYIHVRDVTKVIGEN